MTSSQKIAVAIGLGVVSSIIASWVWEKYHANKATGLLTSNDQHSSYFNFIGSNPYTDLIQ